MHKLFNTKKAIFTLIMSLFFISNNVSALSCGDIIMTDTVMTEDLYCPWTVGSGLHALEFGSDNITLDMNGHSISGENGTMSNIKIAVISHKNITIKNGSIVDSTFPIQILNSESIYIKDITFYNVSFIGIYSSNSTKVYIENNDFYYVETGIHVYNNSMLESTNSISKN